MIEESGIMPTSPSQIHSRDIKEICSTKCTHLSGSWYGHLFPNVCVLPPHYHREDTPTGLTGPLTVFHILDYMQINVHKRD